MDEQGNRMADVYCARASAKTVQKDFQGAIDDLNTAIGIRADAWTYFLRGEALLMMHHYDDALADFVQADNLGITVHHDIIDLCKRPERKPEMVYVHVKDFPG